MTRRLVLASSHFAPSNLVGGHRARLLSRYLPEFGWEPIVVTGDPRHYQERPDPDLLRLVAPSLEVVHASTLPHQPLVGDVGIRAFWGAYRAIAKLVRERAADFLMVTIPSNFFAPLGRLVHRRFGVPFGIDYQDPWVAYWPGVERKFSRAWGSYTLATMLEPWSVKGAALITGMAPGYVAGMLERNPEVARNAVVATMPMGSAPEDFALVSALHRAPFLFDPADGRFHMVYAGAMLPAGFVVLDAFLSGLRALKQSAPAVADKVRVHFVGTGTSPDDPNGHQVLPRARAAGVTDMVDEHPHRIGYVDTLNHFRQCSAVLVLGSTERHYTPSKVFQAILSQRPVFAMLHAESTATGMIEQVETGRVLPLTENAMPEPSAVASALTAMVEMPRAVPATIDDSFEPLSARASARAFAEALDQACVRGQR
ncbi:MAG: hypothetical protein J0J01_18635 [Reyranella sp.]|uniref:glycosyltransferase n=1 Tax=Reyranella sp. TaxID=1929291 RepID=UPI001AC99E04|nr:hypothetical protein [Reyranella sp.]MBN9088928.1 hypothetical protein [Reyranella sp.]